MILYSRYEAEVLLDWMTVEEKKAKLFKYMLDVRSNFIYNTLRLPKDYFISGKGFILCAIDKTKEWLYATHPKLPEVIKRFLLNIPMFHHIKKNQIGFQWNVFLNRLQFHYTNTYLKKKIRGGDLAREYDNNLIFFLEERAKEFIPRDFIKRQH